LAKKIPQILKEIKKVSVPEINYAFNKNISYSQLSIYSACPHRWGLRYRDGYKVFEPSIHAVFGTALHITLQEYLTVLYEESKAAADRLDSETTLKNSIRDEYQNFYDKNKNVSVFEFDVNSANLLRITNFDELTAFDKEYCTSTERYRNPDWVRLAKEYDGIEIAPYIYKGRYEIFWYHGWDVASGCIWNPKGLKIKKLM
jgi:hypothetical protein